MNSFWDMCKHLAATLGSNVNRQVNVLVDGCMGGSKSKKVYYLLSTRVWVCLGDHIFCMV